MKITVVINTLNEELNIKRALNSVKGFANEVVVVDMKSDDNTQEIARTLGAKVYEVERMGYVEPARNFALSKANGEWVFILDADEELSSTLAVELKRIVEEDVASYVRIPRKNMIFGKFIENSRWWPDYNIRFFKRGKVTWNDEIHSIPLTEGQGIDLEAEVEKAIIHHHYTSVAQYLERLNRYTTIQAKMLTDKGYKFNWTDIPRKGLNEFLSRYFAGDGYKDGLHGLTLALLQAFSEVIVYVKIWEFGKFKEENIEIRKIKEEADNFVFSINHWLVEKKIKAKNPLSFLKKFF